MGAGLEGLRIHDLRPTAVALWIKAGANPKLVTTRAGQASLSFCLDRYSHLFPDQAGNSRPSWTILYTGGCPARRGISWWRSRLMIKQHRQ